MLIGVFRYWRRGAALAAVSLIACTRHAPSSPESDSASALETAPRFELTYLGTAGWSITVGAETLLLDPYFTRADVTDSDAPLLPNRDLIAQFAPERADYILVGHSHYDHLLDVPIIATRTGATIVGTQSTLSVARASGLPESRLSLARPGTALQLGTFSVRPLASMHSLTGEDFGLIPATVSVPLAAKDYEEGSTLAFLVTARNRSIVLFDSANFDEAALGGLEPDIAVVATALREKVENYSCRLLTALGHPSVVLPTHFDAHWEPLAARETRVLPDQRDDVSKFVAEVAACSPSTRVIVPNGFEVLTL